MSVKRDDAVHPPQRTRYPLQLGIAAAFTLLIVVVGAGLVGFNYSQSKKAALDASRELFDRVSRQVGADIRRLYVPAEALVDLTTQLPAAQSTSEVGRMDLLRFFAEALDESPTIASLYVGYDNGEFFQLRALRHHAEVRAAFNAPGSAMYVVVSIYQYKGKLIRQHIFFDRKLGRIGTRQIDTDDFDPRRRPWYQAAIKTDRQVGTGFYTFHLPRLLGTTLARRTPNRRAVVGADLTLHDLAEGIGRERITPSSEILVFGPTGAVMTRQRQNAPAPQGATPADSPARLPFVHELGDPLFETLYEKFNAGLKDGEVQIMAKNREWLGSVTPLPLRSGNMAYLAVLVPIDELLTDVRDLRNKGVAISAVMVLIAVLLGWWLARRIAISLRTLAGEAQHIRQLRFDTPVTVRSRFTEVDDLARTMAMTKAAMQDFIETSKALSAEPDFARLMEGILDQALAACHADGGGIALLSDDEQQLEFTVIVNNQTDTRMGGTGSAPVKVAAESLCDPINVSVTPMVTALRERRTVTIDDVETDKMFNFASLRQRYATADYRCHAGLFIPLRNRKGDMIGVLELINPRTEDDGSLTTFRPEVVSYVTALSSQAAIALDNRRLLKAQKELLDSFIQLIAGAIDAKSAYTSGHCQRVPELAGMLARAAHDSEAEAFRDFRLTNDDWYTLHIASWLHDCGKVTTPEYVVDKATKLECLYDRINEVRMRFEVLWRDAQIVQYQALAAGEIDRATLQRNLDDRLAQLRADFAFVAECNVGGEFMADERIARLREIAGQSWQRYFDDRLGLSHEVLSRKAKTPASTLPAPETLLADKAEHIVEREPGRHPFGDNEHGFDMDVPAHAFNLGELHNLSVRRGTLTDEERFKINEHITQTIMLLGRLPFPRELRQVPRWAGNHHEKLDGTGYPRRLKGDQLSIPERIMAIADIFEALTAADRPYKKAKTLSESIRIMSFMRNDGHICPELFSLFLTTGVFREYAKAYLAPEQIDDVDITRYLAPSPTN